MEGRIAEREKKKLGLKVLRDIKALCCLFQLGREKKKELKEVQKTADGNTS